MKVILIALSFILTIIGCRRKSELIVSENIKSVTITRNIVGKESIVEIHDPNQIDKIVDVLNWSTKEPRVFKANYEIKIYFKKGLSKVILGNGDMIKVDGLTYKLNQEGNSLIKNY